MSNGKCDVPSILFELPKARRWLICILEATPNYKSHIKSNMKSSKIVTHFLEECKWVFNLRFVIVDVLNNVDHFPSDEIEDLLCKKEQFCIGTLVTQQKRVKWDLWREENKAFSKRKVTAQMNFLTPVFG